MQFLEKTLENMRNHEDIKLVKTARTKNNFVLEPNHHTTKFFI